MLEDKKFCQRKYQKVICNHALGKGKIISTRTKQKEFIKKFNIYWHLCKNQSPSCSSNGSSKGLICKNDVPSQVKKSTKLKILW